MRRHALIIVLTALVAALPQRVAAQPAAGSPAEQLRRLTVSGVHVGMLHGEAIAKLKAAGWTISDEENFPTQPSYKSALARAVRDAGGDMPRDETSAPWFTSLTKSGEELRLRHAIVPAGAVVDQIKYGASRFQIDHAQFYAMIRERYGPETTRDPLGGALVYCIRQPAKVCDKDASMATPTLWAAYQGDGSFVIVSEIGWAIRDGFEAKMKADVAAALGRAKPSF